MKDQSLPEVLRDILLTPYEAERQRVQAERVEMSRQLRELSNADDDGSQFTQQDHEEYNAWLDELYAAEELERLQRERNENVQDR